jgi:hypothetical protein
MGRTPREALEALAAQGLSRAEGVNVVARRMVLRHLGGAGAEVTGDRELMLRLARMTGEALRFAWLGLRRDKELVLAAVRSDGLALQWASAELKGDREVVLAAVQNNGLALQWSHLKSDAEVIQKAVEENEFALQHATNHDIVKVLTLQFLRMREVDDGRVSALPAVEPAAQPAAHSSALALSVVPVDALGALPAAPSLTTRRGSRTDEAQPATPAAWNAEYRRSFLDGFDAEEVESADECSVCLEPCVGRFTILPCGHRYHTECLHKWLTNHRTCPNCRQTAFQPDRQTQPAHSLSAPHSALQPDRPQFLPPLTSRLPAAPAARGAPRLANQRPGSISVRH